MPEKQEPKENLKTEEQKADKPEREAGSEDKKSDELKSKPKAAKTKKSRGAKKSEMGLVHVYTGDGKGKTTTAFGLALRAVGHGFRVCVVQFMKGGRFFGEIIAAEKKFPRKLFVAQFGQSTPFESDIRSGRLKPSKDIFMPFENEEEEMEKALKFAQKTIKEKKYDMLILDEINVAMNKKLIKREDILELILSKPKNMELVLTGRDAPKEITAIADYVTEIREVKHPFNNKKTVGRRGVEY